eukprot:7817171-Pyramimonas_sp.AAC.1
MNQWCRPASQLAAPPLSPLSAPSQPPLSPPSKYWVPDLASRRMEPSLWESRTSLLLVLTGTVTRQTMYPLYLLYALTSTWSVVGVETLWASSLETERPPLVVN